MSSLSEQLKKLGVEIGTQNLPRKKAKQPQYPVHTVIHGEELLTKFGPVFRISEKISTDEKYGSAALDYTALPSILINYFAADIHRSISPEDFVFIDTETTGLGLGTGTFAFLIGLGKFQDDNFVIEQYFLRDPAEEPAALASVAERIPENPIIVSFNGKAFDIPLLTNRYILNSISTPFGTAEHLDLLHLARRLWRERLSSRTLINLEGQILAAQRSHEDVPGWVIPQLYNDYLNTGDARLIKNVFYHNGKDVLAMAALLNFISDLLGNPFDETELPAEDLMCIGLLHQSLGNIAYASDIFRFVLKQDLPTDLNMNVRLRLALILKREGLWEEAIQHWKLAAGQGQIDACIELAKYFEHQEKNFSKALHWTETAVDLLSSAMDEVQWLAVLQHRQERLIRKMNQENGN